MSHGVNTLSPLCNSLPLVQWTELLRQKLPSDLAWGWVSCSCFRLPDRGGGTPTRTHLAHKSQAKLVGAWVVQDGICGQRIVEELWAWVLPPLPTSLFPVLPL